MRLVPLIDQAAKVLDDQCMLDLFTEPGDRLYCSPAGGIMDDAPIRRELYAELKGAKLGHLREKSEPIVCPRPHA